MKIIYGLNLATLLRWGFATAFRQKSSQNKSDIKISVEVHHGETDSLSPSLVVQMLNILFGLWITETRASETSGLGPLDIWLVNEPCRFSLMKINRLLVSGKWGHRYLLSTVGPAGTSVTSQPINGRLRDAVWSNGCTNAALNSKTLT